MLDFLGEKWNKAAVDAMNDIDDFVQIISLGPKWPAQEDLRMKT